MPRSPHVEVAQHVKAGAWPCGAVCGVANRLPPSGAPLLDRGQTGGTMVAGVPPEPALQRSPNRRRMKVSTLILTLNEASNLPACLAALTWCDDVVVLDSGSTDDTVKIAVSLGARVVTHAFDCFADQRNYGLDHVEFAHQWVLHLDADEIVSPDFAAALSSLEPSTEIDGYRVPFKMMLFGKWLRHAGMWPAHQVRIGHARRLRFVQVGHGQREALPPSRVGDFSEAIEHYSFSKGMLPWLQKHLDYAADEAALVVAERRSGRTGPLNLFKADPTSRRRVAKSLASRLPNSLRPLARFTYVYVWRLGFLDGRAGLTYALLLSTYEAAIAVLAEETERSLKKLNHCARAPPERSTASTSMGPARASSYERAAASAGLHETDAEGEERGPSSP